MAHEVPPAWRRQRMYRVIRHLLLVVFFVLVAGCAGGGCSSGCSCGGVTPLAEGFDQSRRVENAASLRLTDSGLSFLEQNVGTLAGLLGGGATPGVLTFEIPPTSQDLVIATAAICPNGADPAADPPECVAEIDFSTAQLAMSTVDPHNITITGPLPLRIQKLPVRVTWLGIFEENIDIVLNALKTCPGAGQPFKDLALNVDLSLEIDSDPAHSRYGYTRLRVVDFSVPQQDILDGMDYCGGGLTPAILSALESFMIGFIYDSLIGNVTGQIEDALCQQANPALNPACPSGSFDVNGVCRYGNDPAAECVSVPLGIDGHIELGALLGAFGSPGKFDMLLAAGGHGVRDDGSGLHWGDLDPIAGGATLGMYGGTEPAPPSGCVTPVSAELPGDIPIPDEILANTVPGWPAAMEGPHVGFAVSERFLNYSLAQMYNAGAFCLGITGEALGDAVPLSSALLGPTLGAPSLTELGRQKQAAAIAILLQPSQPPTVEIGNGTDAASDPLLHLIWPQVGFDFYVWSLDRYIRAFTATMDLDVPVNLTVTPEGLQPVVEGLGLSGTTVKNGVLVREDTATIASGLEGLLGDLVGSMLGDALPPIDLAASLASLGLTLEIPPSTPGQGSPGLRLLTKGGDDFLGVFATLGVAPGGTANLTSANIATPRSRTTALVTGFEIDPAGLTFEGHERDNGPRATLLLGSNLDDGSRAVEWQYKLDRGPWHPFSPSRNLIVDDPWLRVPGRHVVRVRSRVVGQVASLDPEPVEVELLVDAQAPTILLREGEEARMVVQVRDDISPASQVMVRVRLGRGDPEEPAWGPWSQWIAGDEIAPLAVDDVSVVEAEAFDESEHVGTVRQLTNSAKKPKPGKCSVPQDLGSDRSTWPGAWWLFALAWAWRQRRVAGKRAAR